MHCARVLRPGGVFINTFSTRWFSPKVIRIWKNYTSFERVGLVLEYYLQSGALTDIETVSFRGWPRPENDAYYPRARESDPSTP